MFDLHPDKITRPASSLLWGLDPMLQDWGSINGVGFHGLYGVEYQRVEGMVSLGWPGGVGQARVLGSCAGDGSAGGQPERRAPPRILPGYRLSFPDRRRFFPGGSSWGLMRKTPGMWGQRPHRCRRSSCDGLPFLELDLVWGFHAEGLMRTVGVVSQENQSARPHSNSRGLA